MSTGKDKPNNNQKRRNNFAMQATILAAASIISKLIGMIYNIPFANLLEEEGNGYYGMAQTVYYLILLIATFSIPQAVSKIMAEKIEKGEYKNVKRIFDVSMLYVFIVGLIAAGITFFGAPYFVSPSAVLSLRVLAPTVFLSGFASVYRGYFQAYGNMVPTSISQVVEQVFNAIFSIAMAILFMNIAVSSGKGEMRQMYGAAGGTVGTGVAVLAGLIYMIILYNREKGDFYNQMENDTTDKLMSYKEAVKLLLMIATPIIFSSFIYNINGTLDMKMYYAIMSGKGFAEDVYSAEYGLYSRYYLVLANIPIAMAAAVASTVIPRVSASHGVGDIEGCKGSISKAIQLTMVLTIPCAVGFMLLGKPIITMLYPSLSEASVHTAGGLLLYGGISIVFYGFSSVLNGVLQGVGKVNYPVLSTSIALVFHIIMLYLLLKYTNAGTVSFIAATLLYVLIIVFMNYWKVKQYLGYSIEWNNVIFMPLLAAVIMGAAVLIIFNLLRFGLSNITDAYICNAISTIVSIIIAAITYCVCLLKFGGYTEEMLMAFPKGTLIVKAAKKFHLI